MWAVLLEGNLLKFHRNAYLEHLPIIGQKGSGLFRRKYLVVSLPENFVIADAERSFALLINIEIPALPIFQKNEIRAIFEKSLLPYFAFPQTMLR
jgi:hypothetical protein